MTNEVYIENSVQIPETKSLTSFSKVHDSIKQISVKIEAARAGKINGNLAMYTPKAMIEGMHSFINPFKKTLQDGHYGDSIGVVSEAEYVVEFFPKASKDFLKLISTINKASTECDGPTLVSSIRELVKTKEYNSPEYLGMGTANVYGDIYDLKIIKDLKDRDAKAGSVSIGGKSSEVYCSICAERLLDDNHPHQKGYIYNDELCFYIHNDLYLDHCGFVTNPADKLTRTEVITDEQSSLLNLDVINYTKNSMGNLMNLLKLKESAKDATAVKALIDSQITDAEKATLAKDKYEASLKGARSTSYLLTGDKVLNLKTPIGIAVAENLVSQFDDADEDKAALKDIIDKAKAVLNIENVDQSLAEFLTGSPAIEVPAETADETKTEVKDNQDTPDATTAAVTKESISDLFRVTDADKLVDRITGAMNEKLDELTKAFTSKIEDRQKSSLRDELNSLRTELEAGETLTSTLQQQYSDSLIELIRVKKGGNLSEDYVQKLKGRSVEGLKQVLEDLEEDLNKEKDGKVVDPNLVPVSQSEAVQTAETTKTEEVSPEEKKEETPEAEVKVKDEQDPQAWFTARIGEVGLAQASREYKTKFNN